MITYKYIENTLENIVEVEKLRYKVFKLGNFTLDTLYFNELMKNKKLIFAAFNNEELIAATYISCQYNSIFIDKLFVDEYYQETGFKIGRNLLSYVLSEKQFIENFYERKFDYSKIEYINEKTKALYIKFGYNKENNNLGILKARI